MDRRQFIKRSLQTAVGLSLAGHSRWLAAASAKEGPKSLNFSTPPSSKYPRMVIAKGKSPAKMFRASIEAMGGMGRFVSKGDRVVVKPNASWDSDPAGGADTDPELVGVVVDMCRRAGASRVIALDRTIDEPRRCFARSGIGPAVDKAGGVVEFQHDGSFRKVDVGGAVGKWPVFKTMFDADKFINVPVVKQHGLSRLTAAMKNLYGIIGGSRPGLHPRIDGSIAALARFVRPTLVVLDATRVMVRNGPSGGRPEDLIHPHTIAVGVDQVALDAYAAGLIGLSPSSVGYIALADKIGLGTMNYRGLGAKKIDVS